MKWLNRKKNIWKNNKKKIYIQNIDKQLEELNNDEIQKQLQSHVGKYYKHDYGSNIFSYIHVIGIGNGNNSVRNLVIQITNHYNGCITLERCYSIYTTEGKFDPKIVPSTKEEFDSKMELIKQIIKDY